MVAVPIVMLSYDAIIYTNSYVVMISTCYSLLLDVNANYHSSLPKAWPRLVSCLFFFHFLFNPGLMYTNPTLFLFLLNPKPFVVVYYFNQYYIYIYIYFYLQVFFGSIKFQFEHGGLPVLPPQWHRGLCAGLQGGIPPAVTAGTDVLPLPLPGSLVCRWENKHYVEMFTNVVPKSRLLSKSKTYG